MTNVLGYAASIAVLATFLMPTMLPLRFVAILSNILFLLYGYSANIPPVLFLHATLLPINVVRLMALWERGILGQRKLWPVKQSLASHPEYHLQDPRRASTDLAAGN
jgi:hypothetical protein